MTPQTGLLPPHLFHSKTAAFEVLLQAGHVDEKVRVCLYQGFQVLQRTWIRGIGSGGSDKQLRRSP